MVSEGGSGPDGTARAVACESGEVRRQISRKYRCPTFQLMTSLTIFRAGKARGGCSSSSIRQKLGIVALPRDLWLKARRRDIALRVLRERWERRRRHAFVPGKRRRRQQRQPVAPKCRRRSLPAVTWDFAVLVPGVVVEIQRADDVVWRSHMVRRRLEFPRPGPGTANEVLMFHYGEFSIRVPRGRLATVRVACPGSGPALAACPF